MNLYSVLDKIVDWISPEGTWLHTTMKRLYVSLLGTQRQFGTAIQPRVFLSVNLAIVRLTLWYPFPFLSLNLGWMLSKHPYVLQMYFGFKCDAAQSSLHGDYQMLYSLHDIIAVRILHVDTNPVWSNQGGA